MIDVNVYPQKLEARFANERQVHDLVYLVIKKTLSSTLVVPVYDQVGEKSMLPSLAGEKSSFVKESLGNYSTKSNTVESKQKTILKEIFDAKFEPEIVPQEKKEVARRPRVIIHSTGDEVILPDQPTQPGQVRDVNVATVSGLAISAGADVTSGHILP